MKQDELVIPRKWSVSAEDRRVVVRKRPFEREEHVYMKIFIWSLYLADYPSLEIERSVDRRYKPDVVALDDEGKPEFWGEAGHVSPRKLKWLVMKLLDTHLVFAKWDVALESYEHTITNHLRRCNRNGTVDVIRFPRESARRYIDDRGRISITFEDISWKRLR